jgi:PTS system fructose-specific IIC component/PTS system nitrogen regulatory IIA component
MLLTEIFLPELINCNLKGRNKDEIFEEMVDQFCRVTRKDIRADVLAALREREARMSTGVQHGIAIPHGKTPIIDGVFGLLGVSRAGVDYDAADGLPVNLIFMVLAPPVKAEAHLTLLQRMAGFLRIPAFYTDILNAPDEAAVYAVLKGYERR